MGSKFDYIDDEALPLLVEEDEECQHCGSSEIDVYAFNGEIINAELSSDPDLAKEEPEIYYACAQCINGGNLKPDEFREDEIKCASPKDLWPIVESESFRKKPYVMFMQSPKWPHCCGDMTEYLGDTPNSGEDYPGYKCWEPMSPSVSEYNLQDFYPLADLEVMYTMNLFKCRHCQAKYWNFQYSGFLWPGPKLNA